MVEHRLQGRPLAFCLENGVDNTALPLKAGFWVNELKTCLAIQVLSLPLVPLFPWFTPWFSLEDPGDPAEFPDYTGSILSPGPGACGLHILGTGWCVRVWLAGWSASSFKLL